MPDMSDEEETPKSMIKEVLGNIMSPLPLGFVGVLVVIGLLGGWLIYALAGDKVDTQIGVDKGFLFLAAIVFGRMVLQLNFFPMQYKSKIMKGKSKNLRTNMAIYKPLNQEGGTDEKSAAIVMVAEGDVGKYNRANRSLTHFTETVPSVLFMLFLVGPVFPQAAFGIVVVYSLGRVLHQRGEAESYGAHGKGFMLSLLSTFVLEGLCWICAVKSFFPDLPLPQF